MSIFRVELFILYLCVIRSTDCSAKYNIRYSIAQGKNVGWFSSITNNMTITSHHLWSSKASTMTQCALQCVEEENCGAISYTHEHDVIASGGTIQCTLIAYVYNHENYIKITDDSMSYAILNSRSALKTPTVSVVEQLTHASTAIAVSMTTSSQSVAITATPLSSLRSTSTIQVVAVLGTLFSFCDPTSGLDIIILTSSGVYIFDNILSLADGACRGPEPFNSSFKGYSQLPALQDINCGMVLHDGSVEIYADGQIWRWSSASTVLTGEEGSFPQAMSSYLGPTGLYPSDTVWCTSIKKFTFGRYFYTTENKMYRYGFEADVPNLLKFDLNDTSLTDTIGYTVNLFNGLHDDIVGVAAVNSFYQEFLVIDSSLKFYLYLVDYSSDAYTPTVTLKPPYGYVKFN